MDDMTIDKNKWASEYAKKILHNYLAWETPLGIDDNYLKKIKQDLMEDYENPLRKSLIEETY